MTGQNESIKWGVPPRASWARLRLLRSEWGKISLPRALVYEALYGADSLGVLLDIGGGAQVPYRQLLQCENYHSINIDKEVNPSWSVKIGEPFPCEPGFCDVVLCLNTLEHVYDADFLLGEASRSLKIGGTIHIATPFLYPVHGCPDDYFRPTPSWYKQTLSKHSFESIQVQPLVWGPFSTGAFLSGLPGPAKRSRMWMAMGLDILYSRFRTIPGEMRGPSAAALGFWVRATKK
jgi:SAM-dependent methyltransferase